MSAKHTAETVNEVFNGFRLRIDEARIHASENLFRLLAAVRDLKDREGLKIDIDAFLMDRGVPRNDIATVRDFYDIFKVEADQNLLRDRAVSLDFITAIADLDGDFRRQAMRRLKIDAGMSLGDITILKSTIIDRKRSDSSFFVELGNDTLEVAAQRLASIAKEEFQRGARQLYSQMLNHRELSYVARPNEDDVHVPDAWSPEELAAREASCSEIMTLANGLLTSFEKFFGSSHAKMRDWMHVGLENASKRYLAEAHYALTILAAGGFTLDFPSFESTYHHWSTSGSIYFLAGSQAADLPVTRFDRRPLQKLNAVEICAGGGSQALGLEAAGFHVRALVERDLNAVATLRANRDWDVHQLDMKRQPDKVESALSILAATYPRIDLLAGSLPSDPWGRTGKGTASQGDLFSTTERILKALKPKAFFFETAETFTDNRHLLSSQQLVKRYRDMGYFVKWFPVSGAECGLAQKRDRIFIVGIEVEYEAALIKTMLPSVGATLGNTVVDIIFPDRTPYFTDAKLQGFSRGKRLVMKKPRRSKAQKAYDIRSLAWIEAYGHKIAPDMSKYPPQTLLHFDKWNAVGFMQSVETDALRHPASKNVSLTIPILKRLHGIPDDWEFNFEDNQQPTKGRGRRRVSDPLKEQANQICRETPPQTAMVMAGIVHQALTGDIIDYKKPTDFKVSSNRTLSKMLLGLSRSDNPELLKANDWRNAVDERAWLDSLPGSDCDPELTISEGSVWSATPSQWFISRLTKGLRSRSNNPTRNGVPLVCLKL